MRVRQKAENRKCAAECALSVRRDKERRRGELLRLWNEERRREPGGMSGDGEVTDLRLLGLLWMEASAHQKVLSLRGTVPLWLRKVFSGRVFTS